MSEKPVTLILSDLHVGGGAADPGDDHIHQGQPLARLIDQQAATPEGRAGGIELFFNGDFLEFAQTNQAAFTYVSDRCWCTESESLAKLETILAGHPRIFDALRHFQASGNQVTIAAGNHDVDLAWPAVQNRLREAAGAGLRFEIGKTWVERHQGRLQIGHGHMHDTANRFEHWEHPIITADRTPCLEMCPGTLFMVKFVNRLEAKYPFADNLLPVTKLISVLWRDDKAGWGSVAWLFMKLAGSASLPVLGAAAPDDVGSRLLQRARDDPDWRAKVDAALAAIPDLAPILQQWRGAAVDTPALQAAMLGLLGRIDDSDWHRLFDIGQPAVLGGDDGITLVALAKAAFEDGKLALRVVARDRAEATGAQVVVMGHTHQPDERPVSGARYFNPGCWTRYLELKPDQRVTLEDLRDESVYPYALNYVRVESRDGGPLDAGMVCFERWLG
jgi:UDP-2,3-diacylglucosamine pyrophosphatase LpxH